jgi:uncharacterized protein (TIGR03435 family)
MVRTILILLAVGAGAQTPAPPTFEVASIKPHGSSPGRHYFQFLPGGRLHAENTWIEFAIVMAFDLKGYQVIGAPDWSKSQRFDIEAKAPEGATKEQMKAMLQTLLADRCQLRFHREAREFSVFNLVVAKGGPRLRELKEGQESKCTRDNSEICGIRTMQGLADWLTAVTGRPVADHTGIAGNFDVLVTFDVYEVRNQPAPPGYEKPTLNSALRDQLGLRLEAAKAPIPVLAIDNLQRPSDN